MLGERCIRLGENALEVIRCQGGQFHPDRQATLQLYLDPQTALTNIPTLQMLAVPAEELHQRCEKLLPKLQGSLGDAAELNVCQACATVGGGALPLAFAPFGWHPVAVLSLAALWWLWEDESPRAAKWIGFAWGVDLVALHAPERIKVVRVFGRRLSSCHDAAAELFHAGHAVQRLPYTQRLARRRV